MSVGRIGTAAALCVLMAAALPVVEASAAVAATAVGVTVNATARSPGSWPA